MYFSIFKEISLLIIKYIAIKKNNKIGKSSVCISPGTILKCGINEIKNKMYKGEKLLSVFIYYPH